MFEAVLTSVDATEICSTWFGATALPANANMAELLSCTVRMRLQRDMNQNGYFD